MAAQTKEGIVWAQSLGTVEINSLRPNIKANNSNHHSHNNIQTKLVPIGQEEEAAIIGARRAKLQQDKVCAGEYA